MAKGKIPEGGSFVDKDNGAAWSKKNDIQKLTDTLVATITPINTSLDSLYKAITDNGYKLENNITANKLKNVSNDLTKVIPTGFMLLHNDLEKIIDKKSGTTVTSGWGVLDNLTDKIVPSIALIGSFSFLNKLVKNGMTMQDFSDGLVDIGKGIVTFVKDVGGIVPELTKQFGVALSNVVLEFGLTANLLKASKSGEVAELTKDYAAALIQQKAVEIIESSGYSVTFTQENGKTVPKIKRDTNGRFIWNEVKDTAAMAVVFAKQKWILTLDVLANEFLDLWTEYQTINTVIDNAKSEEVSTLTHEYSAALIIAKCQQVIEESGFEVEYYKDSDGKEHPRIKRDNKNGKYLISTGKKLAEEGFVMFQPMSKIFLPLTWTANRFLTLWKDYQLFNVVVDTTKKANVQAMVEGYAAALLEAKMSNIIDSTGYEVVKDSEGKVTGIQPKVGYTFVSNELQTWASQMFTFTTSLKTGNKWMLSLVGIETLFEKAWNTIQDTRTTQTGIQMATVQKSVQTAVEGYAIALLDARMESMINSTGFAVVKDSNGEVTGIIPKSNYTYISKEVQDGIATLFTFASAFKDTTSGKFNLGLIGVEKTFERAWDTIQDTNATQTGIQLATQRENVQKAVEGYAAALLKTQILSIIEQSGYTYDESTGEVKKDTNSNIKSETDRLGYIITALSKLGIQIATGAITGAAAGGVGALVGGALAAAKGIAPIAGVQTTIYLGDKIADLFVNTWTKTQLVGAAIDSTKTDNVKKAVEGLSIALMEAELYSLLAELGFSSDQIKDMVKTTKSGDIEKLDINQDLIASVIFGQKTTDTSRDTWGKERADNQALVTFKTSFAQGLASAIGSNGVKFSETAALEIGNKYSEFTKQFIANTIESLKINKIGLFDLSTTGGNNPGVRFANALAGLAESIPVNLNLSNFLTKGTIEKLTTDISSVFTLSRPEITSLHDSLVADLTGAFAIKDSLLGKGKNASIFQLALYEGIREGLKGSISPIDNYGRNELKTSLDKFTGALINFNEASKVDLSKINIPDYTTVINELKRSIEEIKNAIIPDYTKGTYQTLQEYSHIIASKNPNVVVNVSVDENGNTTSTYSVPTESSSNNSNVRPTNPNLGDIWTDPNGKSWIYSNTIKGNNWAELI